MNNRFLFTYPKPSEPPNIMPVDLMLDPLRKYSDIYQPILNINNIQPDFMSSIKNHSSSSSKVNQLSADMQKNIEEDFAKNHFSCKHTTKNREPKRVSWKNVDSYYHDHSISRELSQLGTIREEQNKQQNNYQRKVICFQDEFDKRTALDNGTASTIKENWYKKYENELPRNKYGCEHSPKHCKTCNQIHQESTKPDSQPDTSFRHTTNYYNTNYTNHHHSITEGSSNRPLQSFLFRTSDGKDCNVYKSKSGMSSFQPENMGKQTITTNQQSHNFNKPQNELIKKTGDTKHPTFVPRTGETRVTTESCKIISNYLQKAKINRQNLSGGTDNKSCEDQKASDTTLASAKLEEKLREVATLKALQEVSKKIKQLNDISSSKKSSSKPKESENKKYDIIVLKKMEEDDNKSKAYCHNWYKNPLKKYTASSKKFINRSQDMTPSWCRNWRIDPSRTPLYIQHNNSGAKNMNKDQELKMNVLTKSEREFGTQYEPSFENCINKERLMKVVNPLTSSDLHQNGKYNFEQQFLTYNFNGLEENFSNIYKNKSSTKPKMYNFIDQYGPQPGTVLKKPVGYVMPDYIQQIPKTKITKPKVWHQDIATAAEPNHLPVKHSVEQIYLDRKSDCKASKENWRTTVSRRSSNYSSTNRSSNYSSSNKSSNYSSTNRSTNYSTSNKRSNYSSNNNRSTNYLYKEPNASEIYRRGIPSRRYLEARKAHHQLDVKKNLSHRMAYGRSFIRPNLRNSYYNRPIVPHLRYGDRGHRRPTPRFESFGSRPYAINDMLEYCIK